MLWARRCRGQGSNPQVQCETGTTCELLKRYRRQGRRERSAIHWFTIHTTHHVTLIQISNGFFRNTPLTTCFMGQIISTTRGLIPPSFQNLSQPRVPTWTLPSAPMHISIPNSRTWTKSYGNLCTAHQPGSIRFWSHGRILLAINLNSRQADTPLLARNTIHNARDMLATSPPGRFFWGGVSCYYGTDRHPRGRGVSGLKGFFCKNSGVGGG